MKQPLSRKIFIYFAVVVVISIASVGYFSYQSSSVKLNRQNEQHLIDNVSNAVHLTDLYLQTYERIHLTMMSNPKITQFLDAPPADDYELYRFGDDLKKTVIDPIFIRNPEVMAVYLFDFQGNLFNYVNPALSSIDDPMPQVTIRQLNRSVDENGHMTILNQSIFPGRSNEFVTIARKIRGQDYNGFKGILAMEIKSEEFSTLWSGMNLGDRGFFCIVDDTGRIVYYPDRQLLGTFIQAGLLNKIKDNQLQAFSDASFGEERMFVSLKSMYSEWNLFLAIPTKEIQKPLESIRYSSVMIGGLTLLAALLLSYRFGRMIVRPIQILKKGMRQTEQGNWTVLPLMNTRDELDDLIRSYNIMVVRLSELMETLYKAELDKKDAELERQKAELQSLQLQINPHFLYNTFESIICYAVIQESEEITEIVEAISYMFRYSVQTNIEETVIVNELKHVLNYLIIMKHRTGREFELDVRMPPEFYLMKMVRLTLQPLVENIFQHAFADGIEEYHYIRLDASIADGNLVVVLEDNGAGIAPDRLAHLQAQLESNRLGSTSSEQPRDNSSILRRGGLGLMNVNRRIQLVFGEQYGLQIESEAERYTRIHIVMPKQV